MEALQMVLPSKLGMKDQISLTEFCNSLEKHLGDELESIILHGNASLSDYHPESGGKNILVLVEHIDTHVLKKVMKPVYKVNKMGFEPVFLTKERLVNSTDVFPIKYQSMKESYIVLRGEDVLENLEINHSHLRLRCEQELRLFSLRLEKYYIENKGKQLKNMLSSMVADFIETLRVAVLLKTDNIPPWDEAINKTSKTFKIDASILHEILKLRNDQIKLKKKEVADYYNQFMSLVAETVKIVDHMK